MKKNSCYSLNISNKYSNEKFIRSELKNIYQMLKKLINDNYKYRDISFIIGISNKKSSNLHKTFLYTGFRGRPKKMIIGEEILWHFHIYIFDGEFSSASSFCNYARMYLMNKKKLSITQTYNDNSNNAINYLENQCISVWRYGPIFNP